MSSNAACRLLDSGVLPFSELRPTVTSGVLSNVTPWMGTPAMLQSTAAVHRGNSGGVLLSEDGVLLGLVTWYAARVHLFDSAPLRLLSFCTAPLSNTSSASMGVIPHVNLSIAAPMLEPISRLLACVSKLQDDEERDRAGESFL